MLDALQRTTAWLLNCVRVNRTAHGVQNGMPVVVKRRRAASGIVIWFGNRFLVWARSGVRMFVRADEWMAWEAYCSGLLYPERPGVKIGPGKTVSIAAVDGVSLRRLANRKELDIHPIRAAARELRRVHQLECSFFRSAWSHSDLHLDNVLYDRAADRAVLVDFDTRHECGIDQTWRHSDDLKVFLLELISIDDARWLQRATAFLEEYCALEKCCDSSLLHELSRQLVVPRGFARILWYTRTNCLPIQKTEQRLQCLRERIQQVAAGAWDRLETPLCNGAS
jgi:hypothetical protein